MVLCRSVSISIYTPLERGWLFSIVYVGNIIGTLTLPYIMSKFEMRVIMTIYGLISAFATLFTPTSVYLGYIPLLAMRFLQGFATSLCNTSMGSITSQWSTIKESGFFLALLSSHYQFGQFLTMPTAGVLCESRWGWPALYYIQGVLTTLIAITFYIFYRDNPYRHKFVSAKELLKIEEGKINVLVKDGGGQKDLSKKVPYKAMLTDFVVWGIVLSINFIRIGYLIFIQFGPIYLNKVMKFNVKNTGIGSALPFLGSIILKLIAGQLSDCVTCIPMKLNLIFFVTIAGVSQAMLALRMQDPSSIPPTQFEGG